MTGFEVLDAVDGRQLRSRPLRGQLLRRAEVRLAARQELEQARAELAEMLERAEAARPSAPPEWRGARAPAEATLRDMPIHSSVVDQHYAGVQRVQSGVSHPELANE